VATEGFDDPGIEVIVQARPTKSRCLYSQIIGRSTRTLPGIVDAHATPDARRATIAASEKPSALIIDFVGNSGRHKLMTTADILGGKHSEQSIKNAVDKAKASGNQVNMAEAIEEEEMRFRQEAEERRQREAARKAHLVATAQFSAREINPLTFSSFNPHGLKRGVGAVLTEKQANILRKQGIDPSKVSYSQGKQIIGELFRRWDGDLCTIKQAALLQKHGYETKDLSRTDATKLIDALANNGWRRPEVAA
jgi:hypothetical protein